jgi:aryl-alcohol dehydrogenase-like predicted oxidoreductase
MNHRPLGRTGLQVSPLVLGAMMFGGRGNQDRAECVRIVHAALDAGINLVDTADLYGQGESERIVGEALAGRRDDVILATKFHGPMGADVNRRGGSRRWVMQAVEDSLTRLGTDWIDLYQVHRPTPGTDFDETLGALSDLMHQGKIRAIGTSTFSAAAIVEGQWLAERRGRERVVCEQPPYSILARGIEADVLPVCERYGMGVLTWSPLSGGWLSGGRGSTSRAAYFPERYDLAIPANQAKLAAVEALERVADEAGLTLIHLALAFVLEHPAVTAAIVGPRTFAHLESQLGAAEVRLSPDVLDAIDAIVAPGVTLNSADVAAVMPALTDPTLRRRP